MQLGSEFQEHALGLDVESLKRKTWKTWIKLLSNPYSSLQVVLLVPMQNIHLSMIWCTQIQEEDQWALKRHFDSTKDERTIWNLCIVCSDNNGNVFYLQK